MTRAEKHREYNRMWRARNKEKMRGYFRKWRERHREEYNAIQRDWRKKNREAYNAIRRKYDAAHPEVMRRAHKKQHFKMVVAHVLDCEAYAKRRARWREANLRSNERKRERGVLPPRKRAYKPLPQRRIPDWCFRGGGA